MSSIITVSVSGTAWLRDMQAQGKPLKGGWAEGPNAAYYASLDRLPMSELPTSLQDLIGLQEELDKGYNASDLAAQVQQQVGTVASEGIPLTGNLINTKA